MWQSQTHPKGLSLRSVRVPLALLTAATALTTVSVAPVVMCEAWAAKETSAAAVEAMAPAVDRVAFTAASIVEELVSAVGNICCGSICCNSE